jgi:hypothetical protein
MIDIRRYTGLSSLHRGTSIQIGRGLEMARNTKRTGSTKGAAVTECCGQVCDDRCRETSVREEQFGRRFGTAGGVRVV